MKAIRSLLIANRSEISIRVMRAAAELGIRTTWFSPITIRNGLTFECEILENLKIGPNS